MLGSLILYLKGMGIMMFQLSGFYCKPQRHKGFRVSGLGSTGSFSSWLRGFRQSMQEYFEYGLD